MKKLMLFCLIVVLSGCSFVRADTGPILMGDATYTVQDTDIYLIKSYPRTKTIVKLPDPTLNEGRKLVFKTLYNTGVDSDDLNVQPLNTYIRTQTILTTTTGKWAELVSNGSVWIIMEAN
jgi:hypothetical protein